MRNPRLNLLFTFGLICCGLVPNCFTLALGQSEDGILMLNQAPAYGANSPSAYPTSSFPSSDIPSSAYPAPESYKFTTPSSRVPYSSDNTSVYSNGSSGNDAFYAQTASGYANPAIPVPGNHSGYSQNTSSPITSRSFSNSASNTPSDSSSASQGQPDLIPLWKPASTATSATQTNESSADNNSAPPTPTSTSTATASTQSNSSLKGHLQDLHDLFHHSPQTTVTYTPLAGIMVIPVIEHGGDIAFGDLPLLFANEYAQYLAQKTPQTRVYSPSEIADLVESKGLSHVYDQVIQAYIKTTRPDASNLDYLIQQLTGGGTGISRVIFVEANLDMNRPTRPTSFLEITQAILTDGVPTQMRYFVQSHLRFFDSEQPSFPLLWVGNWERSIKNNKFNNVTPSVFSDSDSKQAFSQLSRQMSDEIFMVTPKEAYMAKQVDTAVQGRVASQGK